MPAETKRILIVEDEANLLELLSVYLAEKFGWEVVGAGSGEAALAAFEVGKFHMLLTDVNLGKGPDGIEIARRLLDREPPLKVVVMSGELSNAHRVKEADIGTFMAKPFELPELGAALCCCEP